MRTRLLPIAFATAALSGCFATQRNVMDVSLQIDTLTLQVKKLGKLMGQIQANQADLDVKMTDLKRDVSILNENLTDNREGMSRLSSKMDDLGVVLGGKVSTVAQQVGKGISQTQQRISQLERERQRLETDLNTFRAEDQKRREEEEKRRREEEARREAIEAGPKPSELYNEALSQIAKKKYDLAIRGLELYLKRFPKGERADEVTYHLGRAFFLQKNWTEAARRFATVLDRYPKSEVTAATRLLYASCLIKMKDYLKEARAYLKSIPKDFPRSPEAQKAKALLRDWAKKEKKKRKKKKSAKKPASSDKKAQ